MQVLVSGQAGLMALQTATGFSVRRLDAPEAQEVYARDIFYYFDGCNDVARLSVETEADAQAAAERAWAVDRAVRLFVILLDPEEEQEGLVEVGEALDELLAAEGVAQAAEAQLLCAPLPHPIDARSILAVLGPSVRARSLFERFLELQSSVSRVRNAFDQVEEATFGGERKRRLFLEQAIDAGSFRTLVTTAGSGEEVNKALFQLYSDLRGLENSRDVIKMWTASFERSHLEVEPFEEPTEGREPKAARSGLGGRQAFERAMIQQEEIVARIRAADFATARRFARELVKEQRRSSSVEHIAKSLTNLSQRAKRLEVIDLALEWVNEAAELKWDDPLTHAQRADLLMRIGRYGEARESLDLAETFGEVGFAVTGRARMLRYQGLFKDALAAYRAACVRFGTEHERGHYNMAGVAECLRDLERLDEALAEYDRALETCQYVSALHAGRAATLVEMGRFDEANSSYVISRDLDDDNVVPRNGIASLLRQAGEFERAEEDYRGIIADFPFDVHSRGGLVSTLRDLGRFEEAVSEARSAIEFLPASPDVAWFLADALIDAGRLDQAAAVLDEAIREFPYSAGLRHGMARVERARGRYGAALALYDDAARRFPSNHWIQVGRADILRRLGNLDEALRIYVHALQQNPHKLSLRNAIASIHIHEGRFDEALDMLTVDDPRSVDDWRNFVLRGMLDVRTGYVEVAIERLEWGFERCPFRKERRMLAAALARLQLQKGVTRVAVDEGPAEPQVDVAELVRFRASAAKPDKGPARALYEQLQASFLPEPYHELRDEIARHYNVVQSPPRRNLDWVVEREGEALLLEAA